MSDSSPSPAPLTASVARPTMRTIAARAGVSAMTVSRALRNSPKITAPVRERIQQIALELDYRPDPTVTKLMNHLRMREKPHFASTIAAITSIPLEIEPSFLLRARESARERASQLGFGWEVFRVADPERFNRTLQRTLLNRGIEGVMLLQMAVPSKVDALLDWSRFAAVAASPSVLSPTFPRVLANYFTNARLLCNELAALGCSRIAFVGPESFCLRTRDAFVATATWQSVSAGVPPARPLIYRGARPKESALRSWFQRERPDAVIAHTMDAMKWIERNLQLRRRKVTLACTNVDPDTGCMGIDEQHNLIGRKAVDVLTSMIFRHERNLQIDTTHTLVDGRWVAPQPAVAPQKRQRAALRK
jgi:DNA-binding LacI/PurR family transcriptional regulator